MPGFGYTDGFYVTTLVTGPSHALIRVRLAESGNGSVPPRLTKLPPVGGCDHGTLDPAEVSSAVLTGFARANEECDTDYRISEIQYVDDDSPRYELHERCAYLMAKRLASGDEFPAWNPPANNNAEQGV